MNIIETNFLHLNNMKKIFVIFFSLLCLNAQAQVQDLIYYRYILAEPQGKLFSDKCKLRIDDGIKPTKEKGEKGETITFNSYAAALMYLTSQGWELVSNYSTVRGGVANGYGGTYTSTYWILRRPCSKEEVQDIVNKSLVKDEE